MDLPTQLEGICSALCGLRYQRWGRVLSRPLNNTIQQLRALTWQLLGHTMFNLDNREQGQPVGSRALQGGW